MKLVLLLAAGALAAQDTTPPVISLMLDGNTLPSRTAGDRPETTCEVGDSAAADVCPDPTCKVFDHHDGDISGRCQREVLLINNNNTPLSGDASKGYDAVARTLRSMWELRYTATDKSNNAAQSVSFVMIIRDTKEPSLTTPFMSATKGSKSWTVRSTDSDTACGERCTQFSQAEACNIGTNYDAANAEACTWKISLDAADVKAYDDYDTDVTEHINVKLQDPDGTWVHGGAKSGDLSTEWNGVATSTFTSGTININTNKLGDWTLYYQSCDLAMELGADADSNCAYQTVTIAVSDNRKPLISKNTGQTGSAAWEEHPDQEDGTDIPSGQVGSAAGQEDVLECKVDPYVEAGALCTDLHDSYINADGAWEPTDNRHMSGATLLTGTITSDVNYEVTGDYTTTYTCKDFLGQSCAGRGDCANHVADEKVRNVKVVDTRPPSLTMMGNRVIFNSAGAHVHPDGEFWDKPADDGIGGINKSKLNDQVRCEDTCDEDPAITRTLYFGEDCGRTGGDKVGDGNVANFPEFRTGTYSIHYQCHDYVGLHDEDCRTIKNEDHTKPIITVLGSDHMTLEATHTGNYIDDGATCSDEVDGVISQDVRVSGEVVNLANPREDDEGKAVPYLVKYECNDNKGHAADPAYRWVYVKQTSCPTCKLLGCKNDIAVNSTDGNGIDIKHVSLAEPTFEGCTVHHEANFQYDDAGAVCEDPFEEAAPTQHISGILEDNPDFWKTTGTYYITYRAQNAKGLWNDGSCRGRTIRYTRTVVVIDTLKPVVRLRYPKDGNMVLVAKSGAEDSGVKGETNSAYDAAHDADIAIPSLMAEERAGAPRPWALAAAAAAVAGVALLAVARKRSDVVVSVPV